MTTIRVATIADVPRLVEMGQRFRRESPYADRLPDNPEQMGATTMHLIESPDGMVIVAETDGRLIGMIGLLAFLHHFSGVRTVGELVFWVEPEHRGCGVRLLRQAERWATEQGATRMQMIAPVPSVVGADTLYERLGYHAIELAFEKELPCL